MSKIDINQISYVKNVQFTTSDFLSKNAIIYGLNGSGKSTIKEVFLNLFEQTDLKPQFSKQKSDIEVSVGFWGSNYTYSGGTWNRNPVSDDVILKIYDQKYVEKNLLISNKISDKNTLPKIIFGTDNISKYEDSLTLHEASETKLATYKNNLLQITSNPYYSKINNLVSLLDELNRLLITNIIPKYTYDTAVKKHIENKMRKVKGNESWLKKGLVRARKNICPMCGQSLRAKEKDLFSSIKNIIVESQIELNNLQASLAILDVNINELLSDMQSDTYDYKIGNIDSVKKSVSSAIYNKLQDCSVQIDIDDFAIIKNIIDKQAIRNDRFNDIKNINTLIKLSNNRTKVLELFNQTIRQGWDFLRPLKDEMIQALEKYEESKFKSRSALERTLLEFEDKIETINKDLGRYNLKYKVSKTTIDTVTTKYKQRRSLVESSLVLEHIISGKEVKESEFEETLSEGEKSVLVWTLFIHQIKRSLGSSNTILIIDDPIASYDNFRRFPMLYDIKTLISLNPNLRCIVLTHEKSFASVFEMLSSFHLYLMKSNSLEKVNIYEIKQNELVYLIHRIKEIMSDPVIDINNIVEMFVSFRKVIELDQEIMTKTNILSGRHEMAFNDISKMLHCESNDIYKVTRKFLCKLYEKQLGEKCPITKMRTTYDILTIAKANLNNPYSSRIVVEEYLRQFLTIEQKKKTLTIGQTFNLVKDKIDQEKRINIANSLAVINSVFHSGKGVGLSYREIEEYEVQKLIALSNSI